MSLVSVPGGQGPKNRKGRRGEGASGPQQGLREGRPDPRADRPGGERTGTPWPDSPEHVRGLHPEWPGTCTQGEVQWTARELMELSADLTASCVPCWPCLPACGRHQLPGLDGMAAGAAEGSPLALGLWAEEAVHILVEATSQQCHAKAEGHLLFM